MHHLLRGDGRLCLCKIFVDEGTLFLTSKVVDIMRVNVDKVLERDQKLSELDDRAG